MSAMRFHAGFGANKRANKGISNRGRDHSPQLSFGGANRPLRSGKKRGRFWRVCEHQKLYLSTVF